MSWKSFVTAGLLCVLASPAFAAPTVSMTHNGTQANAYLNDDGNWVWTVVLSQSNPAVDLPDPDGGGPLGDPTPGSPLAAELGFTAAGGALVSASKNATDFDKDNPGNVIFGWEALTNLGGSGACDSATPGNCPVGLQVSLANNQVFSALGSVDYGTDSDGKDYVTIITDGPNTAQLAPSIAMSGTYGGSNNQGRIAELNQAWDPSDNNPPMSLNYDIYAATFLAVSSRATQTLTAMRTIATCPSSCRTGSAAASGGTKGISTTSSTTTSMMPICRSCCPTGRFRRTRSVRVLVPVVRVRSLSRPRWLCWPSPAWA